MKHFIKVAAFLAMALSGTGSAYATTIPPTISTTLTITTDSTLTDNVSCTVIGPCIKFGAPNITLNLNGFTMTGIGAANSCPAATGQIGVYTNGQNNVSIEGPGLVKRFDSGILVSGNSSNVEGVEIIGSCEDGIAVSGSFNHVQRNSISRSGLSSEGSPRNTPLAGIVVFGGNNTIAHNEVGGGGTANSIGSVPTFVAGIVVSSSQNNLIEKNAALGNSDVGIFIDSGSIGNTVRRSQALGNIVHIVPGPDVARDIFDANALPANTYDNNLCEISQIGPSQQDVCQRPDIAGHSNPIDSDGD